MREVENVRRGARTTGARGAAMRMAMGRMALIERAMEAISTVEYVGLGYVFLELTLGRTAEVPDRQLVPLTRVVDDSRREKIA